jgi:hypothetical protein
MMLTEQELCSLSDRTPNDDTVRQRVRLPAHRKPVSPGHPDIVH